MSTVYSAHKFHNHECVKLLLSLPVVVFDSLCIGMLSYSVNARRDLAWKLDLVWKLDRDLAELDRDLVQRPCVKGA